LVTAWVFDLALEESRSLGFSDHAHLLGPQIDARGCWIAGDTLLTADVDQGRSAKGDSGGPALVTLAGGGYAIAGVTQGSAATDGRHHGSSNRVDTDSRAFDFLTRNVGVMAVAQP
jgi:hypothetical protein